MEKGQKYKKQKRSYENNRAYNPKKIEKGKGIK